MPRAIKHLLLFLAILSLPPCTAAGPRIETRPNDLVLLAQSLVAADIEARLGFADIMLAELQQHYEEEIRVAAAGASTSATRAAKLRRWRAALQSLVNQIVAARLALSEGVEAVVHVDAKRQVLLFIDGQAIAFATPRPDDEPRLGNAIVARHCGLYDCQVLDGLLATPGLTRRSSGAWSLSAGRPPAYEINGVVRCEFRDLAERSHRQQVCERLADELQLVASELQLARDLGHALDWPVITATSRGDAERLRIDLNASGEHLLLDAPRLAALTREDRQRVAEWLQAHLGGSHTTLTLQDVEYLPAGEPSQPR